MVTSETPREFNERRSGDEQALADQATDRVRAIPHRQLAKLHTDQVRVHDNDAPPALSRPDVSSLALSVIAASTAPSLLLDGECLVLAASDSFCRAFQLDPADVADRPLARVGDGEWAVPQLDALLRATGSGNTVVDGYEMDLPRQGHATRHLVIDARKLDDGSAGMVRLLLSIADVTEALLAKKSKDALLREKSILLQELQHRVANSLQIIASLLIQSARRVDSDETRSHLNDAHHRVMSVAALQRQLAVSTLGEVKLRSYLVDLCRSIGASMIRDHDRLSLNVSVDDSVIDADGSVSVGLIVTELVINALRHAFPDHAGGRIEVDYRSEGPGWTLWVSDNGIGMPAPETSRSGLGSSIIDALATKLKARVDVSNAAPGTMVRIVHP